MNIKPLQSIAAKELSATGNIGEDYKQDYRLLEDFVTFLPDQWDKKRLSIKAHYNQKLRDPLTDGLLEYHQRLNAPDTVIQNIQLLAQPDTLVVMTGQQPGLIGGPMYTISKAVSVIKLANKLKAEMQTEVVPVFWSASEDHDWAEVNNAGFLNRQDELISLNYPITPVYPNLRVGEIPLAPVPEFWQRLEQELIPTEFTPPLLTLLSDTHNQSGNWGEWFARLLWKLFGQWGLIIADANLPALRNLLQPIIKRAIKEPLHYSRLVNEQGEKLAALGYKEQIKRPPQACCFFLVDEQGRRQRVDFVDGFYRTETAEYTQQDLTRKLKEEPQAFSANVVLRPAGGDYLFPNLAYIGGDAEIAYFAQLQPVYQHLGVEMPILLPRHSFTLVEGRIGKILEEYHLDLVQLKRQPAQLLKQVLRQECRLAGQDYWLNLRREMLTPLQRLRQDLEQENLPTAPLDLGLGKIDWQLNQIEEKVVQQYQKNNQLLRQRINRAQNSLFPQGNYQERTLNFFYFYNKYGPELLPALVDALPEDSRPHYFLGIS
ncbi:MAG: bacillithiol biosynthesis cysteine-adding enzyme BshC [Candidatus Schekmanbacteria bacterium]|nr:bacillithiol biosynthesis cysteine-adding enzyme BshC [Candidatus Schekmanbacteria bacterium]